MFVTKRMLKAAFREVLMGTADESQTIVALKKEIEELKSKKKIELEEIKHLIRLEKEKNEAERVTQDARLKKEYDEKEMGIKLAFAEKERGMQESFHEKVLSQIETSRKESKDLYKEIIARLPNMTATLEMKKRV